MVKKIIINRAFLFLITIFTYNCSTLYYGTGNPTHFNPELQSDKLGDEISLFEDGMRTSDQNGEYEWWYFDSKLDDGSVVVAYFWKLKAVKDIFYIGVNYNKPDGTEYKKIKFFNKRDAFLSREMCDVAFGENTFSGDLTQYSIKINPDDFDGFGFNINLESTIPPYRPQDGIINAGEDYFAWFAAVPNGNVSGDLTYDGKTIDINGEGYHDHNWGNIPLQRLFDSWVWFRGTVGDYTVIGYELNTTDKRGGYSIPGLFIADKNGLVYENYGQNGIFTANENLITDLYKKNDEALFSKLKILTKDNFYLEITGDEVIENLALFEVSKGKVMPFLFNFSKIDPYYTRYKSDVALTLPTGETLQGSGVLEIMDLK